MTERAAASRRGLALSAAVLVGLVWALAPAVARRAPGVRVVSPVSGALVTRTPARIVVVVNRGIRFRAWLGFREITRSFSRSGSTAAATVRIGAGLRYGVNVLSVLTSGGSFASSRFVVGRRARTLVATSVPMTSAGPAAVRAAVGLGAVLNARLNQRLVTQSFAQGGHGMWTARLAPDEGLRFGRNMLQITAYNPQSGFFEIQRRTIDVPRTRPLAGATGQRFSWTGSSVGLSGLSSRAFRPRDRLSYRWRLIRRPRGSQTVLRNATSARPSLVPDVQGDYIAGLTVSERCPGRGRRMCSSTDTVTVTAGATVPIGSQLQTRDANGAIRVDGRIVTEGGFNLSFAVFDRDTLEPLSRGTVRYDPALGGLAKLIHDLVSNPPHALVVMNGTSGVPGYLVDHVNSILADIGATPFDARRFEASDAGWSVVGAAGAPAGSATQSLERASDPGKPTLPGLMTGYLQANPVNHYYGFTAQDDVPFDVVTGQQGDTIVVGDKKYTSASAVHARYFHALSFDARSLRLLDEKQFQTDAEGILPAFRAWITAQADSPSRPLVVIASVGSPAPHTDPAWGDIARVIEKLGGTATVFNKLNGKGDYALVGRVGSTQLAEAATVVTGKPVRLAGVLSRTSDYGYQPLLVASTPQPSQELLAIASQPPQPWPDIDPAADQYITEKLGFSGTDLRRAFYTHYDTPQKWATEQHDLEKLPYPAGANFTEAEFTKARDELSDEIGAVVKVEDYIERLRSPFPEDPTREQGILQKISAQIQTQFEPKEAFGYSTAFDIMSKLLGAAADQFKVPAFKAGGMVAGAMGFLVNLPDNSGAAVLGQIRAKTGQLASDLDLRYAQARAGLTLLGQIIVSDWGKLSTIGGSLLHGIPPRVNSEAWVLPANPDTLRTPIITAAKQVFYSTLMRTAWDLWDVRGVSNARDWGCGHSEFDAPTEVVAPWDQEPPAGQYTVITGFGPGGAKHEAQRALGIPNIFDTFGGAPRDANPPPETLVGPLFKPVDDHNPNSDALGLYPDWFYRDFTVNQVPLDNGGAC